MFCDKNFLFKDWIINQFNGLDIDIIKLLRTLTFTVGKIRTLKCPDINLINEYITKLETSLNYNQFIFDVMIYTNNESYLLNLDYYWNVYYQNQNIISITMCTDLHCFLRLNIIKSCIDVTNISPWSLTYINNINIDGDLLRVMDLVPSGYIERYGKDTTFTFY